MKKGNKNRKNVKKLSYSDDNQLISLLKIIVVLVVIFGLFYGLTVLRTNVKDDKKEDNQETVIQYDEILIGTILDQRSNEYYVLVSDKSLPEYSVYETYIESFDDSKVRVYTSALNSIFNKSFNGKSNLSKYVGKTKIDGILFDGDTLLHIKKVKDKKGNKINKIAEVISGTDKILGEFKKIVEDK